VTHTSWWDRLEPLLSRVERPSRYIDREWGARRDADAGYRAVLLYPDTYEVGQANQAIAILYDILNQLEDVVAERAFVPWVDLGDLLRVHGIPLLSLESAKPLGEFDLLGITLPYELTSTNILEALDLARIPLRAKERVSGPLVIGGGPCVYNPEPLAAFFDAFLVGEGEAAVAELVTTHRAALASGLSRRDTLERLAEVPGVYVPSLYREVRAADGRITSVVPTTPEAPPVVRKRVLADLNAYRPPICGVVPFAEVVHDRFGIEVLRGCTRGCRFCQAGMVYRPVRERSADSIVRDVMAGLACTGYNEVSLTSLSTTDYSKIEEVLRRLVGRLEGSGTSVSLPSLRVDSFGVEMARLVSTGRKSGLTFAPEAGTQRLRDVINKNVTEEDLLQTVAQAFTAGWRRLKLYFMIGLPTETDDDVAGIGELVSRVLRTARESCPPDQRGSVKLAVSVSTFVPKVNTPFQWDAQIDRAEVARRQEVLRSSMPRRGVDLSWHDPDVSFLEGVLARGDRDLSNAIEVAWRNGSRFDAWTERFELSRWLEAFAETGVDAAAHANRERDRDEPLPWEHISAGVDRGYLWRERERALAGKTTPDCSFSGCTGCDACDVLGVDIVTAGVRDG
jgi:radical SAM family uncharacterized protein